MGQSIPSPLLNYNIVDVIDIPHEKDPLDDLQDFREEVNQEIDEVTTILLKQGFSFSGSPDTEFENSHRWRLKLQNLVAHRDKLNYPYVLTTSEDPDSVEHVEIQTPQELLELYLEFFTFETEEVTRGSLMKEQLLGLDEEGLEDFSDIRIMSSEEEFGDFSESITTDGD